MIFILHLKIDLKITIKMKAEVVEDTYHLCVYLFVSYNAKFQIFNGHPFYGHKALIIVSPTQYVCEVYEFLLNYPSTKQI